MKAFEYRDLEHYILPKDRPVQITVSGGRSSGYLVAHIVAANNGLPQGSVATFQNTGFELPETYEFIAELDRAFSLDLHYLERDNTVPEKVRRVGHNSLDRTGEPFRMLFTEIVQNRRKERGPGVRPLPNPVQRVCTAELKTKTAHRYLRRVLGWDMYYSTLGLRADEKARDQRRLRSSVKRGPRDEGGTPLVPLYHAGVTSGRVLSFWRAAPFDLGIGSDLGNCDLCFMKGTWKIKMMMVMYPERVAPWLEFEARQSDWGEAGDRFRRDRPTLAQLWEEVKRGDMSAPANDKACGTCGV